MYIYNIVTHSDTTHTDIQGANTQMTCTHYDIHMIHTIHAHVQTIHTHTHARTHTHVHTETHARTHTLCTHTHAHTHTHTHTPHTHWMCIHRQVWIRQVVSAVDTLHIL